MKGPTGATFLAVGVAYVAGFLSHSLLQTTSRRTAEPEGHRVTFVPLPQPDQLERHMPLVRAAEIDRIRALAGVRARVRGRIYRVGHSKKSNTYFLNFGPSRSAFTGVVFASAVERFEQRAIRLTSYQGKEVELTGKVQDHPQYGLEMVLEDPTQIQLID